jgi:DNA-binding CsgD family transcriptional regulator
VTTLDLTPPTPLPTTEGEPLTVRERVVLAELGDDVTLEQVARRLYVSRNTVKSQVRSIYRKIGVSTRAEAVTWARAAGIG